MPRRTPKAATAQPEPVVTAVTEPETPPDPYVLRRERAAAQVTRDLKRFAERGWGLEYPIITAMAHKLLLSSLFQEHATCPHCGADTGARLPQGEAEARALEMQHLLLEREYQDACVRADIAAFTRQPESFAQRAAAQAMQPPAPEVHVEGANAPVRVHMASSLVPRASRPPLALARTSKHRKRA